MSKQDNKSLSDRRDPIQNRNRDTTNNSQLSSSPIVPLVRYTQTHINRQFGSPQQRNTNEGMIHQQNSSSIPGKRLTNEEAKDDKWKEGDVKRIKLFYGTRETTDDNKLFSLLRSKVNQQRTKKPLLSRTTSQTEEGSTLHKLNKVEISSQPTVTLNKASLSVTPPPHPLPVTPINTSKFYPNKENVSINKSLPISGARESPNMSKLLGLLPLKKHFVPSSDTVIDTSSTNEKKSLLSAIKSFLISDKVKPPVVTDDNETPEKKKIQSSKDLTRSDTNQPKMTSTHQSPTEMDIPVDMSKYEEGSGTAAVETTLKKENSNQDNDGFQIGSNSVDLKIKSPDKQNLSPKDISSKEPNMNVIEVSKIPNNSISQVEDTQIKNTISDKESNNSFNQEQHHNQSLLRINDLINSPQDATTKSTKDKPDNLNDEQERGKDGPTQVSLPKKDLFNVEDSNNRINTSSFLGLSGFTSDFLFTLQKTKVELLNNTQSQNINKNKTGNNNEFTNSITEESFSPQPRKLQSTTTNKEQYQSSREVVNPKRNSEVENEADKLQEEIRMKIDTEKQDNVSGQALTVEKSLVQTTEITNQSKSNKEENFNAFNSFIVNTTQIEDHNTKRKFPEIDSEISSDSHEVKKIKNNITAATPSQPNNETNEIEVQQYASTMDARNIRLPILTINRKNRSEPNTEPLSINNKEIHTIVQTRDVDLRDLQDGVQLSKMNHSPGISEEELSSGIEVKKENSSSNNLNIGVMIKLDEQTSNENKRDQHDGNHAADMNLAKLEVVYISDSDEEKNHENGISNENITNEDNVLTSNSDSDNDIENNDSLTLRELNEEFFPVKEYKRKHDVIPLQKLRNPRQADHARLIDLIEKGITDHKPIESDRFVSGTNSICSADNFESSPAFFYQKLHKRDRLKELPIIGHLSASFINAGSNLVVTEKALENRSLRKQKEMGVELQENKVLENLNSHEEEQVQIEPQEEKSEKDLEDVSHTAHISSRDLWKKEWISNLKMCYIYPYEAMPPNFPLEEEREKLNSHFNKIKSTLSDKYGAHLLKHFSYKTHIIILKGELEQFDQDMTFNSIQETCRNNLSKKKVRIWSLNKISKFLENLETISDTDNAIENAKDNGSNVKMENNPKIQSLTTKNTNHSKIAPMDKYSEKTGATMHINDEALGTHGVNNNLQTENSPLQSTTLQKASNSIPDSQKTRTHDDLAVEQNKGIRNDLTSDFSTSAANTIEVATSSDPNEKSFAKQINDMISNLEHLLENTYSKLKLEKEENAKSRDIIKKLSDEIVRLEKMELNYITRINLQEQEELILKNNLIYSNEKISSYEQRITYLEMALNEKQMEN